MGLEFNANYKLDSLTLGFRKLEIHDLLEFSDEKICGKILIAFKWFFTGKGLLLTEESLQNLVLNDINYNSIIEEFPKLKSLLITHQVAINAFKKQQEDLEEAHIEAVNNNENLGLEIIKTPIVLTPPKEPVESIEKENSQVNDPSVEEKNSEIKAEEPVQANTEEDVKKSTQVEKKNEGEDLGLEEIKTKPFEPPEEPIEQEKPKTEEKLQKKDHQIEELDAKEEIKEEKQEPMRDVSLRPSSTQNLDQLDKTTKYKPIKIRDLKKLDGLVERLGLVALNNLDRAFNPLKKPEKQEDKKDEETKTELPKDDVTKIVELPAEVKEEPKNKLDEENLEKKSEPILEKQEKEVREIIDKAAQGQPKIEEAEKIEKITQSEETPKPIAKVLVGNGGVTGNIETDNIDFKHCPKLSHEIRVAVFEYKGEIYKVKEAGIYEVFVNKEGKLEFYKTVTSKKGSKREKTAKVKKRKGIPQAANKEQEPGIDIKKENDPNTKLTTEEKAVREPQ